MKLPGASDQPHISRDLKSGQLACMGEIVRVLPSGPFPAKGNGFIRAADGDQ
jgi:hypothetical protein